jgi:predicted dehydrogenase
MTSIAIAGAGVAGRLHAAAAAESSGISIRQIVSRTAEGASRLGTEVGTDHGTLAELSRRTEVVVIATPPESHLELALGAIDAGQAVLVEKPLCATLDEADRLIATTDASGAVAGYAENLLFAPAVDVALTHRKSLGTLRHLSARSEQPPPEWGHFLEPLGAGGVLFDLGPHAIALLLAFGAPAEPAAVSAELSSTRADGADDHAVVSLAFSDGSIGEATISWTAAEPTWDLQAASDAGVVLLGLIPEVVVEANGDDVTPQSTDGLIVDLGYRDQIQGLGWALAGRGGRVCPLGFGRRVLEIICAAYLAAGRGSEVPLPYDGPRDRTPMSLWRDGT